MDLAQARAVLASRYDESGFTMPLTSRAWAETADAIRILLDATEPGRYMVQVDDDVAKAVRDAHAYLDFQAQHEATDPGRLTQTKRLAWNSRRLARVLRVIVGRAE